MRSSRLHPHLVPVKSKQRHGDSRCPRSGQVREDGLRCSMAHIPASPSPYFLLLNLHQPSHNNMADPVCRTAASQLEKPDAGWSRTADAGAEEQQPPTDEAEMATIRPWTRRNELDPRLRRKDGFRLQKAGLKAFWVVNLWRPLLSVWRQWCSSGS